MTVPPTVTLSRVVPHRRAVSAPPSVPGATLSVPSFSTVPDDTRRVAAVGPVAPASMVRLLPAETLSLPTESDAPVTSTVA